jgi:DNA-binding MurR/RpiR family transcriptional regulator
MNRALTLIAYFGTLETQSSDYNICKAILDCFDKIENMSATQLASQAFTSEPTIRRFCRKLGFDSFSDFKKALTVDYREVETITSLVIRANNDPKDSILDLYNKSIKSLGIVRDMFSEERLEKFKELVSETDKVRIYSLVPLSYVYLLTLILHSYGIDVSAPAIIHLQREDIVNLDAKSLVILVGDPRLISTAYGRDIKCAYERGVKFCLCLNEKHSILSEYASVDFSYDSYRPSGYIDYEFMLAAIMRAYVYNMAP